MPIYEFKCTQCNELNEIIVLNSDETIEMKCKKCDSQNLERVMSTTNYAMGNASAKGSNPISQTRTCSGGSCTTYDLPGHSR